MSVPVAVEVLDQLTGSYQPDPAHSRLGFSARHAMVTTVHGSFDSFQGRVHLDGHDPRNCSVSDEQPRSRRPPALGRLLGCRALSDDHLR